jgi:uncharacterized protein involved in exopolysaccharide biosynthesis
MQTPHLNNGNQDPFDKMTARVDTHVTPISYTEGAIAPSPYFPHEIKTEEPTGFDVRDFLRRVNRRKWMILTIVTIATMMSAVNSSRLKSIYQAVATIEINNKNQMFVRDGDVYYQDDSQEQETAAFLIQSYPLLEEVVVKLGLDQNPKFIDAEEEQSLVDTLKNRGQKKKQEGVIEETTPNLNPEISELKLQTRSPEESERLAPFVGCCEAVWQSKK